MSEYVCDRCKNPFHIEADLKKHLQRKNKCKKRNKSTKTLVDCDCQCGRTLSSPQALTRHKKNCAWHIKNNIKINMNNAKIGDHNNIEIGNITNNIDNSIKITVNAMQPVPYTEPYGILHLSESEQNKLFDVNNDPHLMLFSFVHCSSHRESYHNIYYDQSRHPRVWTSNGEAWHSSKLPKVLNDVLLVQRKEFEKLFENRYFATNPESRKHIEKYMKKTDNTNPKSNDAEIAKLHKSMKNQLMADANIIAPKFHMTKGDADKEKKIKYINDFDSENDSRDFNSGDSTENNNSYEEKKPNKMKYITQSKSETDSRDFNSDSSTESHYDISIKKNKHRIKK